MLNSKPVKAVINTASSSTTQNVAIGGTIGAIVISALFASLRSTAPDLLPWEVGQDLVVGGTVAALLSAGFSRILAFLRDPSKKNRSAPVPKSYGLSIAFFVVASMALTGCAGFGPAVNGKTHYKVEFRDTTEAQDTNYKMDIKAPAGTELASITGMTYDWKPDGSGAISVSQEGTVDTQGQANMITQVNAAQLEAFQQGISTALNALAPFIGQYLDARVREGEIKAGVASDVLDRLGTTAPK